MSLKKLIIAGAVIVNVAFSTIVFKSVFNALKPASTYINNNPSFSEEIVIEKDNEQQKDQEIYTYDTSEEYVENNLMLNLDEASAKEFVGSISPIVFYPGEEFFEIGEAKSEYLPLNLNVNHGENLFGNKIDSEELVKIVKENNNVYLQSLNQTQRTFYDLVPDSDINDICKIIANTLNDLLANDSQLDKSGVMCKLANLKILSKATMNNAYITNDDVLIVNGTMINILQIQNSDAKAFEETIVHEAVHLAQDTCKHMVVRETDNYVGITYSSENLEVNPLYWSWYTEASAEKIKMNLTDTEALVYQYRIDYMESLGLINIFNNDIPIENYSLYKDPNKFFEMFSNNAINDKDEIIKLMFAIELMQAGDSSFEAKYSNKYGVKLEGNDLTIFRYELKSSICQKLTDIFYSNLATQISNKKIPLKDVFFLIKLFEQDINNHMVYTNSQYKEQYVSFMEHYIEVQDLFFNCLANSLNLSINDVKDLFENHTLFKPDETYNCDLSWCTSKQKNYLLERQNYLQQMYGNTIQEVYDKEYRGLVLN